MASNDIDVTDNRVSELEHELKIVKLALENSLDSVIVHTADGRVVYFNDVATAHAGLSRDEFAALPAWGFSGNFTPQQRTAMIAQIAEHGSLVFRSERMVNGECRNVEVHACYAPGNADDEPLVVSISHDVTQKMRAEEILKHQAFHDSLTGLANRALFEDRLALAIAGAKRHGNILGIAYVDVDEFKAVNDSHGHEVGDRVLIVLGERLEGSVRRTDTAARFGGDEFVLIFPQLAAETDLQRIVAKLTRRLGEPIAVEGISLQLTSSVGFALFDPINDDARSLTMRADIAMYEAKRARAALKAGPR
jgi:diguanylate cyclase (GGDEF)-like protein/PAS domain S-box-containing protein